MLLSLASLTAAVATGLISGTALVLVLGLLRGGLHDLREASRQESIVIIPMGASMDGSNKSFEPREMTVKIGINNTVRWINHDNISASIWADNEKDPDFWNATRSSASMILPNQTFVYTFMQPGLIGYHSRPFNSGEVNVVP